MRDLVKARLCLSPELPSYPVIHGEGWPREAIDGIVQESRAIGHDGIIWQGTSDLRVIRGKTVRLKFQFTNSELYAFWTGEERRWNTPNTTTWTRRRSLRRIE